MTSSRSKVYHILTQLRQAVLNSNNKLFSVGQKMDQLWSLTLICHVGLLP